MKVPTYSEATGTLHECGNFTPLDRFVLDYDDADREGSKRFLADLQIVIDFAIKEKEDFIKEFLSGDPVCPECTEPALVAMGWHCKKCGYDS